MWSPSGHDHDVRSRHAPRPHIRTTRRSQGPVRPHNRTTRRDRGLMRPTFEPLAAIKVSRDPTTDRTSRSRPGATQRRTAPRDQGLARPNDGPHLAIKTWQTRQSEPHLAIMAMTSYVVRPRTAQPPHLDPTPLHRRQIRRTCKLGYLHPP